MRGKSAYSSLTLHESHESEIKEIVRCHELRLTLEIIFIQ